MTNDRVGEGGEPLESFSESHLYFWHLYPWLKVIVVQWDVLKRSSNS